MIPPAASRSRPGTFAGGDGTAIVRLEHAVRTARRSRSTVERAGGVDAPTQTPVIRARPDAASRARIPRLRAAAAERSEPAAPRGAGAGSASSASSPSSACSAFSRLTSFTYGLIVAVREQLAGLDPARQQRQQVDGYVYAGDGHTMLAVLRGSQSRVLVQSDQIAPWMKQAIVAIEDKRFYEHRGVDMRGMARAFWADIREQERRAGRLDDHAAVRQERMRHERSGRSPASSRRPRSRGSSSSSWSKDRILTAYLNTIYFGNGAYGVEQAAQTYFGHGASKLTLPEAALLAGIPADPRRWDPVAHPRAGEGAAHGRAAAMLAAGR